MQEQERKVIFWNVQLWKWYFTYEKNLMSDVEKDKLFAIMVSASGEDIKLFMRFFLYVANSRNFYQEVAYKTMCHFISLMYPDMLMANIELLITLGKKDDILYLMPNLSASILKWLRHKVKMGDTQYSIMVEEGKQIGDSVKRVCRYKPQKTKNYKWTYFFEKLAMDHHLNGIQTGSDFEVLNDYLKEQEFIK